MFKGTLIGRVGQAPTLRTTKGSRNVTNFNVAHHAGKDDQGNDKTVWVPVTAWDQRADYAANSIRKGDMVYIEGGLEVSDWTDKQGERHIDIAVSAQFLKILARSKNDGQAQGTYSPQPGNSAPAAAADDTFSDLPF